MSRTAKNQRSPPRHQTLPPLRKIFADDPGAQAAYRLFELCWCHAGGSTAAIAAFLVGLYNREYASGDTAWLCKWSDDATFANVIATMRWVRQNSQHEIHHIFAGDGGDAMLELMQRSGLWPLATNDD